MNTLLVAPEFPTTYWGMQYALPLAGKACSLPPLGLISLAALLPEQWSLRLVDLNLGPLAERDLAWADQVLVGGMRIQADSMHQVITRARAHRLPVAVGGPAPTTAPEEFLDADVVFCGEAEGRIAELVDALGRRERGVVLRAAGYPSMDQVPPPRFDLLDLPRYASVSVQYSRGCPYHCEFCDVIEIFGQKPRVKPADRFLAELDALVARGYQGSVFVVDDNFIGNRPAVRALMPQLIRWQEERGYPLQLYTEASVNLASDEALLADLVQAGFTAVFVGIETPSESALRSAGKSQNLRMDLAAAVDRLTGAGLEVMSGFIVGFDTDDGSTFAAQRAFIEASPIPLAMVGLLTALPGTALWRRLEREGRLRRSASGDQFGRPNFEPRMDEEALLSGYADLLATIYAPPSYYARCHAYVERAPSLPGRRRSSPRHLPTLARAAAAIGPQPHGRELWRLLGRAWRHAPHSFAWATAHALMGEHMMRYTQRHVLPRLQRALAELRDERRLRKAS